MMRTSDYLTRQCHALLDNKRLALACAVIFSVLPFASWLSVALVSLVTLRKGPRYGFELLLPALVVHSVPLMMLVPLPSALVNTLVAYVPCYLASWSLRKTEQWQVVFGVFLLQAFLGCLLIQLLVPDFIVDQFSQLKLILAQYQELVDPNIDGIGSFILAQLFFGIQILSVIVSAVISLMFARSIQARLFLPGGFGNELQAFRSGRLAFLALTGVCVASYYHVPLAVNILPIMLCYFLASGFSLAYFIFARKRQVSVFILLILLILLKPVFVLFAYIVFGSLDSLFNFRSYLPTRVRESI